MDFVIAETNDYVGEALIAPRGVPGARAAGDGHVRERAADDDLRRLRLRRGVPRPRRPRRDARGPQLLTRARRRCSRCSRRSARRSTSRWRRSRCRTGPRRPRRRSRSSSRGRPPPVPDPARALSCARASRWRTSRAGRATIGVDYIGICCGGAPHHVRAMAEALGRRDAGQPLLARHRAPPRPRDAARGGAGAAQLELLTRGRRKRLADTA